MENYKNDSNYFSFPEQTVPDLMFFEKKGVEHHHDEAKIHHFLDNNLYRAKPRVNRIRRSVL